MIAPLLRALGLLVIAAIALSAARAEAACPPACAGQRLETPNFSHQDLTGAHFENATIVGGVFIRAKLTGANFDGATFQSVPDHPTQTPDFTFADLSGATFVKARFDAPTYFTYATLTCADFSQTNLSAGNAVFGDEPLVYGAPPAASPNCRTKFQGTTMNCEFIDDWHAFDLSSAVVTACLSRLAGRNFDNAVLSGVNLDGAVLDGATFAHANLTRATLRSASLQCSSTRCVDMSFAQLQGAKLDNANLSGASLYRALLSNDGGTVLAAASMTQAHLRNVNLAFATLSGVDLTSANFYGSIPANSPGGCATTGANHSGFTANCASAYTATMNGTLLSDAYLYGVDFSDATISGVDFRSAVLVGAKFAGASINASPDNGATTKFARAYLQGTDLDEAKLLSDVDLTNAYVDFRGGGNIIYIDLGGATHNAFACPTPSTCTPAPGDDVCVWVRYPPTTVPAANSTMTCPDGSPGNCGTADPAGGNARWKSALQIGAQGNGPPPGWYANDATYSAKAADSVICNGKGPQARVLQW